MLSNTPKFIIEFTFIFFCYPHTLQWAIFLGRHIVGNMGGWVDRGAHLFPQIGHFGTHTLP